MPAVMPEPVKAIPGTRPVVLGTVMALAPATSETDAAVAVAGAERLNVVPLVMAAMVAPAGMPAPVTSMPTAREAVDATVTVGPPRRVAAAVRDCPA